MSEIQRAFSFTGGDDFLHHSNRLEGTDVTWRRQRKNHPQEKAMEREFLPTHPCLGLNFRSLNAISLRFLLLAGAHFYHKHRALCS